MTDETCHIGIERRRKGPETIKLDDLDKHIEERVRQQLEEYSQRELSLIGQRFDALEEMFKSAFPNGDPRMHRDYHEDQIEYIREQRAFYADLKKKSAFSLLVFFVAILGSAVWEYFVRRIH